VAVAVLTTIIAVATSPATAQAAAARTSDPSTTNPALTPAAHAQLPAMIQAGPKAYTQISGLAQSTGGAVVQGASGGGCANRTYGRICISFASGTTNPIISDFYLMSYPPGAIGAELFICTSTCTYKYGAPLDHLGHYPAAFQWVSWPGSAQTRVRYFNSGGGQVGSYEYSPVQFYS